MVWKTDLICAMRKLVSCVGLGTAIGLRRDKTGEEKKVESDREMSEKFE